MGKKVSVLVYHSVNDEPVHEPVYSVLPAKLDAQIALFIAEGYSLVSFEDLSDIDKIEKPMILTFDDGYADNYDYLFPILKKYRAKATISVICGQIGAKGMLTSEQLREMSDSGLVSVQSHGMSHLSLSGMAESRLEYELAESQKMITEITGKKPTVFCYPYGNTSETVVRHTAKYYDFGLAYFKDRGCWRIDGNPYEVNRLFVERDMSARAVAEGLSEFAERETK